MPTCPIVVIQSHIYMQFTSNINYYVLQSCSVYVVVQYHMECCMDNHNAVNSVLLNATITLRGGSRNFQRGFQVLWN